MSVADFLSGKFVNAVSIKRAANTIRELVFIPKGSAIPFSRKFGKSISRNRRRNYFEIGFLGRKNLVDSKTIEEEI